MLLKIKIGCEHSMCTFTGLLRIKNSLFEN
nr:MAG TPA: hypothetical protein [Caudoviricetes sp.]